jgi:hypothetical protein
MSELPIACTLGHAPLKARRQDLLGGLLGRAVERLDIPTGYRVRLASEAATLMDIANVIQAERHCCGFLTFRLTVEADAGPIWLKVDGPAGTKGFLAGMFDL